MKEQLITFKTAEIAKDKGFNAVVDSFYENTCRLGGNILNEEYKAMNYNNMDYKFNENSICYSAPTLSHLQQWLRNTYGIHVNPIFISYGGPGEYAYDICREGKTPINSKLLGMRYEEVLEIGLVEALKLIKQKDVNK